MGGNQIKVSNIPVTSYIYHLFVVRILNILPYSYFEIFNMIDIVNQSHPTVQETTRSHSSQRLWTIGQPLPILPPPTSPATHNDYSFYSVSMRSVLEPTYEWQHAAAVLLCLADYTNPNEWATHVAANDRHVNTMVILFPPNSNDVFLNAKLLVQIWSFD